MSACPCIEIEFLRVETTSEEKYAFPTPHIFLIYFFFNLLATLFNSAFRQQPTIRSVKRKRDISRSPVKCDGVGGYFPETLNTKGNFHIGKSQQPSITSLLPLPSTSSFLSLSRLNPTILPISISSPLPLSPSLFRSRNTFTSRCHFTR
jgi:hypothetical protein